MLRNRKNIKRLLMTLSVIILFVGAFFAYTGVYYHADETALAALVDDGTVTVSKTGYGWFFDGQKDSDLLVFYPGAKVEETAYAPLMRSIAGSGVDVCLVKMPFRLAVLDPWKASDIVGSKNKTKNAKLITQNYNNIYVGGHSLGGAMAAYYASGHADELSGVVLLAAYPTSRLDDGLKVISLYGTEDGVLNMGKLEKTKKYMPEGYTMTALSGGNHAGFGNYGVQKGDGAAYISAPEQQKQTAELIVGFIQENETNGTKQAAAE